MLTWFLKYLMKIKINFLYREILWHCVVNIVIIQIPFL